MKTLCIFSVFCFALGCSNAAEKAFFGEPPDVYNPWAVHDRNRPQPPVVEPGPEDGDPPSDAVVLFDGTDGSLSKWRHVKPDSKRRVDWQIVEGALQPRGGAGYLETVEHFGDCQLHLEWSAPTEIEGNSQGRGNSGVFFMGMVEVQILDNYQNPSYADGMAGAVYAVMPPAANALRPPGKWQSYDIIFRRPIVREGKVLDAGSLTVLVNGVVVQDSTAINGGGSWKKRFPLDRVFPEKGPLRIQDHGDPVRFRNIWIRPLRDRPLDGGTDGRLSPEATLQKRAAIAESIRGDARGLEGLERALRLFESLIYETSYSAFQEASLLVDGYLASLMEMNAAELEGEEDEVKDLYRAFDYLIQYGFLDADNPQWTQIQRIAHEQGWVRSKG